MPCPTRDRGVGYDREIECAVVVVVLVPTDAGEGSSSCWLTGVGLVLNGGVVADGRAYDIVVAIVGRVSQ